MPGPESGRSGAKAHAEEPLCLPSRPPAPATSAAGIEVPAELDADFESAPDSQGKLAALHEHFDFIEVRAPSDLKRGDLCALQRPSEVCLVQLGPFQADTQSFKLDLVFSTRHAKPAPLAALLELGRRKQLHRLEPKAVAAAPGPSQGEPDAFRHVGPLIDLGSFTQLLTLAQNCGLMPNADDIANARDQDFRAGNYQAALNSIERLHTDLKTAAAQRRQRLRQEDIDHRAGKLKMTPKEWNQKLARDNLQSLRIEQALSQFRRVQEGLRLKRLASGDGEARQ